MNTKDILRFFVSISHNQFYKERENIKYDAEVWTETVYNFADAYKRLKSQSDKNNLINVLKNLWVGRFVSYAIKTKDMDINEAKMVIKRQAEVFEGKLNYLRAIY